jgi:CRISPR/Cas system CSM-associated protein Csm3 (group 7 of RAMP superfamily)
MNFDKFESAYEIRGMITMETPLRIGKQIAPYSISSAPVLLQYDASKRDYVPFIPGSSLKGVLRSSCERIVKSYGEPICALPDTCSECRVCTVFGAQDTGAKIRVRDCTLSADTVYWRSTEERPHHADKYDLYKDRYVIKKKRGRYWTEEDVPPFTFVFHIAIANATEEDVALVLLGLDEFNHKRAHIGGGVSRGLGFASVSIEGIIEKRVADFRVTKTNKEIKPLSLNPDAGFNGARDFSCYWRADDDSLNGCIVCELEAECRSDFTMKGVDEENITVNGTLIIPGSVIKGFLRKNCSTTWGAEMIDDVFGSTRKKGHRSRILVSDAFPSDTFTDEKLTKGTRLTCWMVFDNMKETELREIVEVLKEENTISGDISAKGYNPDGKKRYNRVRFVVKSAWKFTLKDRALDVTVGLQNE